MRVSLDGFVYLARDTDGNIKIGSSRSVPKRISQLKVKHGRVTVVSIIPAKQYLYLEKILHNHFSASCIYGEWFKDNDIVRQTCEFLEKHGEIFGAHFMEFPKIT